MENIIKDTLISYTGRINRYKTNAPSQYKDRKHQYLADETRIYSELYDRFSSDYVEAWVQGLETGDLTGSTVKEEKLVWQDTSGFVHLLSELNATKAESLYGFKKVHIRLADAVTGTSAIGTVYDNYKTIEIAERQYTYIRRGAKIITMGNTWLAINPDNMSGVQGHAIIERCDNTWNHLDYYGNVVYEPVCVDRLDMRGVDPDSQRSTMINTGYYNIKCQNNEQTRQLGNNSRLYVGNVCFRIAGYAEISREFTEEKDSTGMLIFRAMLEEPNSAIDDLDEFVAGGKTFSWDISVGGQSMVMVGETAQLTASSVRTSEEHTEAVESTENHPIGYIWESSDPSIVTVDTSGLLTGVSEGNATITCYLAQNPSQSVSYDIEVQGDMTAPHLAFTTTIPKRLGLYQTAVISAKYYENGTAVPTASFQWSFTGADKESYTVEYIDIDTATVKCWSGSVYPLTVTVSCEGQSTTASIDLEGI